MEVWEVKELTELTYEQEKILKKKNKLKSVLDDEDNAEKVIQGMLGHEFHAQDKPDDTAKLLISFVQRHINVQPFHRPAIQHAAVR